MAEPASRREMPGALKRLARLYWYTVEFDLMTTEAGLRIFGAGHRVVAGRKRIRARRCLP